MIKAKAVQWHHDKLVRKRQNLATQRLVNPSRFVNFDLMYETVCKQCRTFDQPHWFQCYLKSLRTSTKAEAKESVPIGHFCTLDTDRAIVDEFIDVVLADMQAILLELGVNCSISVNSVGLECLIQLQLNE